MEKGTIKLVFQPGEEGHAGAYHMIEQGALDGVEAIFGLHVDPSLPTGAVSSKPGPMLAGSGRFSVVIRGKGGHAASPHNTRDPILAVSMVVLALQHIVSRETDPLEPRVMPLWPLLSILKHSCCVKFVMQCYNFDLGSLNRICTRRLST